MALMTAPAAVKKLARKRTRTGDLAEVRVSLSTQRASNPIRISSLPGFSVMSHVRVQLEKALAADYAVLSELGSGAAATVYLARDLRHDRDVAVKVLHPEVAAAVGATRFLNEIRITAGLSHPNIIELYDSGERDGFLYYVMPAIEGESLRQKLDREKQLGIDEALEMTRAIAAALSYTHAHDVIHRDIKPENILLHHGVPKIADFGVASAISRIGGARLTATGISMGTPAYMSPEQGAGDREIKAQSDIYSLATVLYEMLVGDPPFTGTSVMAVIWKKLNEKPTRLRLMRENVPDAVDHAVARALEKVPADRFASVAEFAAALVAPSITPVAEPSEPAPQPMLPARRRAPASNVRTGKTPWAIRGAAALLVVGVGGGIALFVIASGRFPLLDSAQLDPLRYVVVAGDNVGDDRQAEALEENVYHAFGRWIGISVVDPSVVREKSDYANDGVTVRDARRLARSAGAGRYVWLYVKQSGTTRRLHASLNDTRAPNVALVAASIPFDSMGGAAADSAVARLVTRLLFGAAGVNEAQAAAASGTWSLTAALALLRGHDALLQWNLDSAVAEFDRAYQLDREYVKAALWSAQARNWDGQKPTDLKARLELVSSRDPTFSAEERLLADGLLHLAQQSYAPACAAYTALTDLDENSFVGWYGRGECHGRDDAVIRDAASPSEWSFRSSYHQAVLAYRKAFLVLPVGRRGLNSRTVDRVRQVLFTSTNRQRQGSDAATGLRFAARPAWTGDTLALTPYLESDVATGRGGPYPGTSGDAIDRHRRMFREIATAWANVFPASAFAWEAVSLAQEVMGDAEALTTLRKARSLASAATLRAQIAHEEILLLVKVAIPAGGNDLRRARALADSLLRLQQSEIDVDRGDLAVAAALVGRVHEAAQLARAGIGSDVLHADTRRSLDAAAEALMAYAALGGPADSATAYENRIEETIRNRLPPDEQAVARYDLLGHAASLAYPHQLLQQSHQLMQDRPYPLLHAQAAWSRSDTATTRRILTEIEAVRQRSRWAERTLDAVYPEAALWAAVGDTAVAVGILDGTLDALRWSEPRSLEYLDRVAGLIWSMVLRADLAHAAGDMRVAARWATPVTILWADADPSLQHVVKRMLRLAEAGRRRSS